MKQRKSCPRGRKHSATGLSGEAMYEKGIEIFAGAADGSGMTDDANVIERKELTWERKVL